MIIKKTAQNNGIFEFKVNNAAGKEAFWTIDLKKTGVVKKGDAKSLNLKPDVTITLSDETFVEIADGKTTGQKAFLTGKLKTKGNMMLATKLNDVLKVMPPIVFLVTAYAELRMLSGREGQGEAVNCGAYFVSAVQHTYLRLIAILIRIVWLCVESGRGSGRTGEGCANVPRTTCNSGDV
jgi:putative sterol carrier protein